MRIDRAAVPAKVCVQFSVLTVSDTATEANDPQGDAAIEVMSSFGHQLVKRAVVRNDVHDIQRALREILETEAVQAVIVSGGTGLSKREVTLEAAAPFQEKSLPGFGEMLRMVSYTEEGSAAFLARASAFVTEGKVVFCLPGREKVVRTATSKLIAPELMRLTSEANR